MSLPDSRWTDDTEQWMHETMERIVGGVYRHEARAVLAALADSGLLATAYRPATRGTHVRYQLWMHACGYVWECPEGQRYLDTDGCDACESASGPWVGPLYIRQQTEPTGGTG